MNNSQPTTERKAWIDYGKGLSIFLVYLNHSEVYIGHESQWSFLFAAFRMPFFFFLSGYLYTSCIERFSGRRKLKQIFRGIVVPYLIFSTVITGSKVFLLGWEPSTVVRMVLLGWASWFVVALGVAQLLYIPIVRRIRRPGPLLMATLAVLAAACVVVQVCPQRLPYCLNSALMAAFFVGLGIQFRLREPQLGPWFDRTPWWWLAFPYFTVIAADHYIIGSYGTIGGNSYGHLPLYLVYAVAGIAVMTCLCRQVPLGRAIRYIGRHSLIFYYLNGTLLYTAGALLRHIGMDAPPYAVVVCGAVATCLLTFPIVWLIDRYAPIITGDKNAFNRLSQALHLRIRW